MFRKIGDFISDIRHTWDDGRYGGDKKSFLPELINKAKDKLPLLPGLLKRAPLLAKFLSPKVLWGTMVAALTLQNLALGLAAVAGSGASFYAIEYLRCRKARNDLITETNMAGQQVRGRRADLSRLHKTQQKILQLSEKFNHAAVDGRDNDDIRAEIEATAGQRSRIVVLDGGKAGGDSYAFFEPLKRKAHEPVKELKAAWDDKQGEEKLAEYIVSLEQSLPPTLREKVHSRRTAPPPVAKPATAAPN